LNWIKHGLTLLKKRGQIRSADLLTILTSFTSVRNSIQAIELLKNRRINVKQLVSHRLPLAEFEQGVKLIKNKQENVKKVLITPNN
jgi:threonine dehydrogenase-like Zn-dependent dehydrogenase